MSDGTIDLTNVVEKMKSTFIISGKAYLVGLALAVPGIGPVASWFVKTLLDPFINWALTKLTEWSLMQAFFWNTALRKGAQAQEYVEKVAFKENLPPETSDDEYEKAELDEIKAFDRFVRVTN